MADLETEWPEVLSGVRRRLLHILREPASAKNEAIQCLEQLEELARLIHKGWPKRATRKQRSIDANNYRIEQGRRGAILAEYFAEDRAPFRVDKKIYEAVAAALDENDEAVPVEDIVRPARKATRPDLPDYLVRACLRFWLSRNPPLVEKVSTRYRGISGLKTAARRAWLHLEESAAEQPG